MSLAASVHIDARKAPTWATDLLIGGHYVAGGGPAIDVHDPTTESLVVALPSATPDQVDAAVAAAREAFDVGPWRRMVPGERAACLHRLADTVESIHDELLAGLVVEIGTPIMMAQSVQTRGAVATLRAYADVAGHSREEHLAATGGMSNEGRVTYLPSGVVAAITAYNVPIAIAARTAGAALAAGCTIVLMPSPRAPLTTLLLARALAEADLPPGVINVVVGGPAVGEQLTAHPGVDKVAFTGSATVGRRIMAQAAPTLKRLSLELGGKASTIVLPGTDIARHVADIHRRYVRNAGQGCMTPGRLLIHRDAAEEFAELSRAVFADLRTGDPWEARTDLGPLIRPDHLASVRGRVERAVADGAHIVVEGPPSPLDSGWFMAPVLLAGAPPDSDIAQEEIFGPVGVVLPYDTVDDAIRIANSTRYGLSADVYAATHEEGVAVADRLRVGAVMINGGGGPRAGVPMGGFKQSGFGREGGEWGVREFMETRYTQWPATTQEAGSE